MVLRNIFIICIHMAMMALVWWQENNFKMDIKTT
jgi:DNA-binding transcriptional regulator of glucitol operon